MYCFAPYWGWNDQQLTKNVGIVPYIFYKEYGFHSVMVTGQGGPYPSLDKYVKGLELVCMESPEQENIIRYIEEHAEDIDVFVMHGPLPFYYLSLQRYKELRPDGKVYLELDPNSNWMDGIPAYSLEFSWFLSQCDVVGVSCRRMQRYLSAKWPCRTYYLPNGFFNFTGEEVAVDFGKKENIILSVGRIGTSQKRNEVLMEAFAIVAPVLKDWRLRLIGSIAEEFHRYLESYFERNPGLRGRVDLTGPIQDKRELMAEYCRAKVFALSSVLEGGTPNVVAEALYGGCYMVTSDFDGSADVVNGGDCGEVFPINDVRALAEILQRVCRDDRILFQGGQQAVKYGEDTFDFRKIAARLYYLLFDEPPEKYESKSGLGA